MDEILDQTSTDSAAEFLTGDLATTHLPESADFHLLLDNQDNGEEGVAVSTGPECTDTKTI